ncbi:unnamed protein product [Microthlaspi erraticum]|uniref:Uncharacterized protein n=1 Tax=Microthlaspi erraticum TaxID=1685480 RepID=A0A6D2JDL7_9BRAS|nr:unnamed protein product [Microthlaspi erraticum]CAA7037803.1 unnamed protein product [Microthlaspi erraticum]
MAESGDQKPTICQFQQRRGESLVGVQLKVEEVAKPLSQKEGPGQLMNRPRRPAILAFLDQTRHVINDMATKCVTSPITCGLIFESRRTFFKTRTSESAIGEGN